MEQSVQGMNFKLKTKEQWFCDICGGVIESANDGMLEWDSYVSEEGKSNAENFRIVHGRWLKGCNNGSTDHLADGHLHWYTGPDGLSQLLSMPVRFNLDTVEFNRIIRRIHIDYYEEGARLLPLAQENEGFDPDPYDEGDISQSDLLWLIRKYGKQI